MRKIAGINPTKISKNFVITIAVMFALFIIIGIIAGCGEDSVTNNNNNNGSNENLIFSQDSISINGTGFRVINLQDTLQVDSGIVRLTFNIETNCDSLQDTSWIYVTAFKTIDTVYIQESLPIRSASYNLNSNVFAGNMIFNFLLTFNSSSNRFMRFKNIKFYN